jgi:hypothetical protein
MEKACICLLPVYMKSIHIYNEYNEFAFLVSVVVLFIKQMKFIHIAIDVKLRGENYVPHDANPYTILLVPLSEK